MPSLDPEVANDPHITDEAKAQTLYLLEREARFRAVLIGGNHLASLLLTLGITPTDFTTPQDVQAKYGPQPTDVWIAWKAIRDLSDHLRSYK